MSVVTFGELLLRLTPPGFLRLGQAARFEACFGGAEANVAVLLAQFGVRTRFVTKLPAHEVAQHALQELRGQGVDVEAVVRGGERMGVYFFEHGISLRPGKVIYDRQHSAFAEVDPGDFDWPAILAGAEWFHWSGITPALSTRTAQAVSEACRAAKGRKLQVSCDLNYRAKLWTKAEAAAMLVPLMEHVDLCVCGLEDARDILGVAGNDEAAVASALQERYGFQIIAMTQRQGESASETSWGATLFTGGQAYQSCRYEISIVDRVGAGDSFTGALIFSLLRGDAPQQAVDFAVAASALHQTISGDYAQLTIAEVEKLTAGVQGGRVER